ncbi:histidine kinase [Schizophyllum commune H4-8]|uniref:histidine kinase n=1 Tax=Schizophyllum commune (strain H4-8 / FGSC 9210) TaxID=578458 RepID=UPI0021606BD2|nr:histidine kinase [Schizophyllum commune H4-8]KAI5897382.1 histidine kinase [Schizophyllum commune H4-8]
MKRKFGHSAPTLYFRDGILSIPGYTLEKALPWKDTGSLTLLAEGSSLKDGSSVLAKIAPAQSNGSMCLEREAHILAKMATFPEGNTTTLRMIDFFTIPKDAGDVVVLLLAHPGLNLLSRHLPSSKINDLLLSEVMPATTAFGDVYMMGIEEPDLEEIESLEIIDLASFLEFAVQSTHCLEVAHKAGVFHREVRANAFHLNSHSGLVRLVHFGNRAVSLENFGSPSALVINAFHEHEKLRVKEALCYLAPEQTGSYETMTQDHRTDLYSLGILFWTLLVGRGQMPFEGDPLELLHAIVQKTPMPVHEVRRDVPQVLAAIVAKLLEKHPDDRYQSAYGLKEDLIECQRRLLAAVASATNENAELIPFFEIAKQDRFMEFSLPIALFGREKELSTISGVVKSLTSSQPMSASGGSVVHHSSSGSHEISHTNPGATDERVSEDMSSTGSSSPRGRSVDRMDRSVEHSPKMSSTSASRTSPSHDVTTSASGHAPTATSATPSDLRRTALRTKARSVRTHTIVIVGPPGVGKSSMVLANQAEWRRYGVWGQAKFQNIDAAPFSALLSCLSSVLRQLRVFSTDLHRFVTALRQRLGPQLNNIPLLYQGAPELRDILAMFNIVLELPHEARDSNELRVRFQSLVVNVLAVVAETRLFALFLDDVHEADDSALDLISTIVNSKNRMLVFMTMRSDRPDAIDRVRQMFSSRSRPTWLNVEPLSFSAVSILIARTLRRPRDDVAALSRFIYNASSGNAFSARSLLTALQRRGHIKFDWDRNYWIYDMASIEGTLSSQGSANPTDLSFLTTQLRSLPSEARRYLLWAALLGETFKVTDVASMMDKEESSSSGSEEDTDDVWSAHKAAPVTAPGAGRGSMRGLQTALTEGWLIQRARDMCSFAHDRYRLAAQAELDSLRPEALAKMSFRIILQMMQQPSPDLYRIAEYSKRCLPLLTNHPKRDELLVLLVDAGEDAWARGAHELAIRSFESARTLLGDDPWKTKEDKKAFGVMLRLAALYNWKGDYTASDGIIRDTLAHLDEPEDKANMIRIQARNQFLRGNFAAALDDTLEALRLLNVPLQAAPTEKEATDMFERVKNEILAVGYDQILAIPHTSESRSELTVTLLNDAGLNAYWSPSHDTFSEVIGLTTMQLALRNGIATGTALGFLWALGGAAERRGQYRLSVALGNVALRLAERYGGSAEKCTAQVLYTALVSGFANVHLRVNIAKLEEAIKYGYSAGDRLFTGYALIYTVQNKLYVCEHISELITTAEDCVADLKLWASSGSGDQIVLGKGILNLIRALGGYTYAHSAETAFDTEDFNEHEYITEITRTSGNIEMVMNWYNAFKLVGYFCLGFIKEACDLGFSIYETREMHPNHRHVRYALFFHTLAMISRLRDNNLSEAEVIVYKKQIQTNKSFILRWASPSPVNTTTWIALIDAELSSLENSPDAFRKYDKAVKLAVDYDWLLEEGWALYMQGSHFVRCGVEGLGTELQRRGIARHRQWGARGIVNYLTLTSTFSSQYSMKRSIFTASVAVQTESVVVGHGSHSQPIYGPPTQMDTGEDHAANLSAGDLAAILQWSKDLSRDINLSSALQRLTEISTETSGSLNTCVVITREVGDYTVATSMKAGGPCLVHENAISLRELDDPLQVAILQHTLNSKERVYYEDASTDPRFASEATQTALRSVICLPIFSNRGQTFGAVYLANSSPFSKNTLSIMTLLCQQASISIANALLFRSVQTATRENLKMIAAQRDALEAARRSREDALKATKIKSNFLASMSHELRTPFSSFYGLLDLLSGTNLDSGQREIVQTAKQSCELLLKIIDSILDYSKLEASALKLEPSGFLVENIIADCMELLLPMAVQKLDLSFNIEPDVPSWVFADYARIRQVLMNLIGNAVKFTAGGYVRVFCSVDTSATVAAGEVQLKFVIQDTGIGLSSSDVDQLFVPFQQADNSSTRKFGGTGLGLSISRQLVTLMGGAIGVQSEINVGSKFWFTIPVKLHKDDVSQKAIAELNELRAALRKGAFHVLVISPSEVTLALLNNMLSSAGCNVTLISSLREAKARLPIIGSAPVKLDFVLLDDQSERHVDEFTGFMVDLNLPGLSATKLIHLYTPTANRTSSSVFSASSDRVIRMTKPPRTARLLQLLAELKNLQPAASTQPRSDVSKALDDLSAAQRTLFGNVLVAEDNIVSQNLLVKQLEKYQLKVTATSNGEEAIAEWESHEPGYFSVALFDHHMPICDGVEATKRLRILENKRKSPVVLPIVALSADCQESTKKLCMSAGMNGFFSKPLKKPDLAALLSMFGHPPYTL